MVFHRAQASPRRAQTSRGDGRRRGTPPAAPLAEERLSRDDVAALNAALAELPGTPYGDGFAGFHAEVLRRRAAVPAALRDLLDRFRRGTDGFPGALWLRGLAPPGEVGLTPAVPYAEAGSPVVGTEKLLLICAAHIGEAIGFADWHRGDRVQNLYPIPALRRRQCASNSVYLEMHTETAFRPNTPTHLALLCLRRDPRGRAETLFCDLEQVVDTMDAASRAVLASPRFCFRVNDETGAERFTEAKPIDTTWRGRRRLHYAEALSGVDREGEAVLTELRRRIADATVAVELQAGDLVLIDNLRMVHGRTAFRPAYDGTDRWLQRVLVLSGFRRPQTSVKVRNPRTAEHEAEPLPDPHVRPAPHR